jgi:hypothetical protein
VPDHVLRGPLDHGSQQRAARPPAPRLRSHGERPDLGLVLAGDHLARVRPGLQHDGPEYPAVVLFVLFGHGDQHRAVAVAAQGAQRRRVPGIRRQEAVGQVGGHPDLADLGQLTGPRVANDHLVSSRSARHQGPPLPVGCAEAIAEDMRPGAAREC